MIDHLEIRTRRLQATIGFYAVLLTPLGYTSKGKGGFGTSRGLDFFVAEGDPSTNVHFAFAAPDRETVDAIYAIGRNAGFTLDREPALASHIHPDYYAGYLRDPDDRLVEFVCHAPEAAMPEFA